MPWWWVKISQNLSGTPKKIYCKNVFFISLVTSSGQKIGAKEGGRGIKELKKSCIGAESKGPEIERPDLFLVLAKISDMSFE